MAAEQARDIRLGQPQQLGRLGLITKRGKVRLSRLVCAPGLAARRARPAEMKTSRVRYESFPPPDDGVDPADQLRLQQVLLGVGQTEVGKHIAAARFDLIHSRDSSTLVGSGSLAGGGQGGRFLGASLPARLPINAPSMRPWMRQNCRIRNILIRHGFLNRPESGARGPVRARVGEIGGLPEVSGQITRSQRGINPPPGLFQLGRRDAFQEIDAPAQDYHAPLLRQSLSDLQSMGEKMIARSLGAGKTTRPLSAPAGGS
jgi:hypothetical protein